MCYVYNQWYDISCATLYVHPLSSLRVRAAILSALHSSSWFGGYAEGQLRLHQIHTS